MLVTIPRGKKVLFMQQGAPLKDANGNSITNILLEEPFTLNLSSTFTSLIGGGGSKGFSVVGAVLRDKAGLGFSGQFKQFGYQFWEKTEPLRVSITVGFYFRTSAYEDVVLPSQALMKIPLPETSSSGSLTPPGPSILEALGKTEENSGKAISCRIGYVRLPSVIIESAEPTVSDECDSDGYPMWIKLRLDISTIFTATSQLIDQFGYN